MKTQIKALIATTLTVISLSTTAFANNPTPNTKAPRAIVFDQKIRKISVSGNVEVLIVQNKNEGVIYDQTNVGEAKVTRLGDLIQITSNGKETAKLILYVNDFYRIEASGNAVVSNYGMLDLKYLQIFLKDHAYANINSQTTGLYSVIGDTSDLKLSGSTDNHILNLSKTAKLTIDKFDANIINNSEDFLAKAK